MRSSKLPSELTDLLGRYDPDVQSVAVALRTAVLDEIGPCHESIFPIKKWISVLYSTTEKRMKDNICLVVVYRDHVNLMFPRGVDLTDPRGLLEGSGKAMRHIKMLAAADVERPGVRALINEAKKRPDLGRPDRPLRKVITVLRSKAAAAAMPGKRKPATWPRLF